VVEIAGPRVRGEDATPSPNGAVERPHAAARRAAAPDPLFLLWSAIVAGLVVFLALGVVRVEAGGWFGRRMSVRQVWARFLEYLADLGAHPLVVVAIAAAAGMTLLGAAYVLWLSFSLRDAPPRAVPDETP
jgi:bacteriorhodopsin